MAPYVSSFGMKRLALCLGFLVSLNAAQAHAADSFSMRSVPGAVILEADGKGGTSREVWQALSRAGLDQEILPEGSLRYSAPGIIATLRASERAEIRLLLPMPESAARVQLDAPIRVVFRGSVAGRLFELLGSAGFPEQPTEGPASGRIRKLGQIECSTRTLPSGSEARCVLEFSKPASH